MQGGNGKISLLWLSALWTEFGRAVHSCTAVGAKFLQGLFRTGIGVLGIALAALLGVLLLRTGRSIGVLVVLVAGGGRILEAAVRLRDPLIYILLGEAHNAEKYGEKKN